MKKNSAQVFRQILILIAFPISSFNAFASESFKNNCNYLMQGEEIIQTLSQEHDLYPEYQILSLELENETLLYQNAPTALQKTKVDAAQAKLQEFYQDKILPLANWSRKGSRATPLSGKISDANPVTLPVTIGGQDYLGSLEGTVKTINGQIVLSEARVIVNGVSYFVSGSSSSNQTSAELARLLGYRSGGSWGAYETVYSAKPFHPSNWIGGMKRYLIFDTETLSFRPLKSTDTPGEWHYYYPMGILLIP